MIKHWKISKQLKGTVISILGVLCLTPDSLLILTVSNMKDMTVQFYRYFLAACTILLYIIITQKYNTINLFRNIGKIGFLCGIIWGASNLFYTAAIQSTTVADVLVIIASNPMISAILSFIILKETIPIRTIITCIVCFGAIAMIFVTSLQSGGSAIGMMYAIFASFTLGLYFVLLRLASKYDGCEPDMMPCNVIACFFSSIVALIFGAQPVGISNRDAFFLSIQGIIEIPLSFCFLTIGPSLIPASEVSLYMLIETVLGPVWVYLAGYQTPSKLTIYGGIILILALGTNSILALREEKALETIKNDIDNIIIINNLSHKEDECIKSIEINIIHNNSIDDETKDQPKIYVRD